MPNGSTITATDTSIISKDNPTGLGKGININVKDKTRFFIGKDEYAEIPNNEVNDFLKDYPHATKVSLFRQNLKNGYASFGLIPDNDTTEYKKQYPNAFNVDDPTSKPQNTNNSKVAPNNIENNISTPNPKASGKEQSYKPINDYDTAYATMVGIMNRNYDKSINPQFSNELSVEAANNLFSSDNLGYISSTIDNIKGLIKDDISNLPFHGRFGRDYLSPEDQQKFDTSNEMVKRLDEIKSYLIGVKSSSGDPKNAMKDGIEYFKYADPQYYNTWIKYAEKKPENDNSPLANKIDSILKKSQYLINESPAYAIPNQYKDKLIPSVRYNIEKMALINGINKNIEDINGHSLAINEATNDMNMPDADKRAVASNFMASETGKKIRQAQDNIAEGKKQLASIDERYPEVVKQANEIASWQKTYDDWGATHKILYNLGTGLANGSKEVITSAANSISDVLGNRKSMSREQLIREGSVEQQHNYLSGFDVPERSGYVRNKDGSIKMDESGNPIKQKGIYKTVYGIADMIPGLAVYALSEGAGESLALPDIAESANEIEGIENSIKANRMASLGRNMGMLTSLTLNNYSNAYDVARQNGHDKTTSSAIASANIMMQYGIFKYGGTPFSKLGEKLSSKPLMESIIKKAEEKGVIKMFSDPDKYRKGIKAIQKIGYNLLSNTATGTAQGELLHLSADVTQSLDENKPILYNENWNTFKQSLVDNMVGMGLLTSIPSFFGDIHNFSGIKGEMSFGSLWKGASNAEYYKPILLKKLHDGDITQEQYNKANENISFIQQVYNDLPTKNAKGNPLSEEAKKIVFINRIHKIILSRYDKERTPEPEKEIIEKKMEAADKASSKATGNNVEGKIYTSNGLGITEEEAKNLPAHQVEVNGKEPKEKKVKSDKKSDNVISIFRHGETEANVGNYENDINQPLNDKGIEQAKELGKTFKERGITHIVTDGTVRTQQTSSLAAQESGIPEDNISVNENLLPKSEYESDENFAQRILKEKKKIARRPKTTSIITHGEVLSMMKALDDANNDIGKTVEIFKNKGEQFDNTEEYQVQSVRSQKKTKEDKDAIQKQSPTEGVLRNQGIPRQSELQGVEQSNQPEKPSKQSEEEKQQQKPQKIADGLYVTRDEQGKIENIINNGKRVDVNDPSSFVSILPKLIGGIDWDYGKRADLSGLGSDAPLTDVLTETIEKTQNPKEVLDAYSEASKTMNPYVDRDVSDAVNDSGTSNPYVRALQYFSDGGKVYEGDVDKLFGNKGNKDIRKQKFSMMSRLTDDHSKSIERIAEDMYRDYGEDEEGNQIGSHFKDYQNELENAFISTTGKKDATEKLKEFVYPYYKELSNIKALASAKFEMLTGLPINKNIEDVIRNGKENNNTHKNEETIFDKASEYMQEIKGNPTKFANKEQIKKSYGTEESFENAIKRIVGEARKVSFKGFLQALGESGTSVLQAIKKRTVLKDFTESGYVNFLGRKITSPADIADLFLIHRSPYIEKGHAVYIKDGKVIGTDAVTSGLPGETIMPGIDHIIHKAKIFGAEGVYMLHNHPSGNHLPSEIDIKFTQHYASELSKQGIKMLGSIVIDTDHFTNIESDGTHHAYPYINRPKKLFSTRINVGEHTYEFLKNMPELADNLLKGKIHGGVIIYTDPTFSIIGYDVLGMNDLDNVNDNIDKVKPSKIFLITRDPYFYNKAIDITYNIPEGDIFRLNEKGELYSNYQDSGNPIKTKTIENQKSLWGDAIDEYGITYRDASFSEPSKAMESLLNYAKKHPDEDVSKGIITGDILMDNRDDLKDWLEKVWKKTVDPGYEKLLRSSGVYGQKLRSLVERARGENNSIIQGGFTISKRYAKALKVFGEEKKKTIDLLTNQYLESNPKESEAMLNRLPESIRPIALQFKSFIMKHDQYLIEHGNLRTEGQIKVKNGQVVLDESGNPVKTISQLDAFKKMYGKYLAHAYRVDYDKDWGVKDLSPQDRNRLVNAFKTIVTEEKPELLNNPDELSTAIKNRIGQVISEAKRQAKEHKTEGYKHREIVSEPYKIARGWIDDTETRMKESVIRVGKLVSNAYFQNAVIDLGMNKFLFKGDEYAPEGNRRKIDAETFGGRLNALVGMQTNEKIYKALKAYTEGDWVTKMYSNMRDKNSVGWKIYNNFYSTMKLSQTALNIHGQFRNFLGRGMISFANGNFLNNHINPDMQKSFITVRDQLKFSQNERSGQLIKEALQRGVINHGTNFATLMERFDMTILGDKIDMTKSKIKKIQQNTIGKASLLYGASDDFWNVYNYIAEKNKYAKAIYHKDISELTDAENDHIADIAGEITKNTQPTYSRVYPIVRALNASPLLGNFLAYRAENYRISYNTINQSVKEIRDENPSIKRIGYKRLSSMMAYIGGKIALEYGAAIFTKNAVNSSIGGLTGTLLDNQSQKQRLEDLNYMVSPWFKDQDKTFYEVSPGVYRYQVNSYFDPYGDVQGVLNALFEPDQPLLKRPVNMASQMLGGAFDLSFPMQVANSLETGFDQEGRPIYDPDDPPMEKALKSGLFVVKNVSPSSITSFINNWSSKEGTSIAGNELRGTFGMPYYYIDANKNFKWRAHQIIQNITEDNYHLKNNYETSNNESKVEQNIKELQKLYNTALRLGADQSKMDDYLIHSRLKAEERYKVFGN